MELDDHVDFKAYTDYVVSQNQSKLFELNNDKAQLTE